jgi:N-acetylglutamate synthase-like GNAT family acetyltransferase
VGGGFVQDGAFVVRLVTLDDAAELHSNCYPMNTPDQIQTLINQSLEQAAAGMGAHLVAELNGVVVGTVNLELHPHGLKLHRATVTGLVVSQAYTRRGIARMLVQACRVEATKLGCTILEISCRAGEPPELIYPKLGFIEYGRLPMGLKESWGAYREYDEVMYYMPVLDAEG